MGIKIQLNSTSNNGWFTFSRPCDRNLRDAELISCRLRRVEPLCRLPGSALQQLAMCGFYEDLEKGVTREYARSDTKNIPFCVGFYLENVIQLFVYRFSVFIFEHIIGEYISFTMFVMA